VIDNEDLVDVQELPDQLTAVVVVVAVVAVAKSSGSQQINKLLRICL